MAIQNVQIEARNKLTLFAKTDNNFNNQPEIIYSNSIKNTDLIPRYYRGLGAWTLLSDVDEQVKLSHKFYINNELHICEVSPVIIKKVNPKTKKNENYLVYPSDAEERIEQVIMLLATRNGLVQHEIAGNKRFGTQFSLYEIFNELVKMKAERKYSQIRQSLQIIRDSRTTIKRILIDEPTREA